MIKKLLFVAVVLVGSAMVANAQEVKKDSAAAPSSTAVTPNSGASEDADKLKIKTEELPDAVKQTLEDQEYKGWLINAAFHNKKKDEFEVELKNGTESQTVRFSKEGQRLDD